MRPSSRSKATFSRGNRSAGSPSSASATSSSTTPHVDGQRPGQGRLLVVELDGAVPDPAGIDEHDAPARAHEVGQDALVVDEPRQPRLHAVEDLALGQALPLGASPRLGPHQRRGPGPHRLGGEHLAAPEELDVVEIGHRALVAGVELGEPVHLVAPQVDPHRQLGRRREHVDDPAPHGQLAAVLDLVLAPVAEGDEPAHELLLVETVTAATRPRGPPPLRPAPAAAAGPAPGPRSTAGRRGPGRAAATAAAAAAPWSTTRG